MNNKRLGTAFEHEACQFLRENGFWVHFLSPDASGAQPFDIIAVKDGIAVAVDCKTSAKNIFPLSRLEDNQVLAFEHWLSCGNTEPLIFVKYNGAIHQIRYTDLRDRKKVDLDAI